MVSEPDPFRQQLAAARHYGNMSQEQLAKALGITKSTLARWESGNTPPPQVRYQRRGLIAELMEITGAPPEIFGYPTAGGLLSLRLDVDRVVQAVRLLAAAVAQQDLDSAEGIDRLLDGLSPTGQPPNEERHEAADRSHG